MAQSRYYTVTFADKTTKIVKAASSAAALAFVRKQLILSADVTSQEEMFAAALARTTMLDATAEAGEAAT